MSNINAVTKDKKLNIETIRKETIEKILDLVVSQYEGLENGIEPTAYYTITLLREVIREIELRTSSVPLKNLKNL